MVLLRSGTGGKDTLVLHRYYKGIRIADLMAVAGALFYLEHTSLAIRLAFFYGYPLHHVAIGDFLKDFHSLYQLTEDGVFAIKPVLWRIGNEELAAVGVRTGISH